MCIACKYCLFVQTYKISVHICHHGVHVGKHVTKHTAKHVSGLSQLLAATIWPASPSSILNTRESWGEPKMRKWVVKAPHHRWNSLMVIPERKKWYNEWGGLLHLQFLRLLVCCDDRNLLYYMASSVSGQDELNPVLWLATPAGKMAWSCPLEITCSFHIMNPLLSKLVWSRWLHIGLVTWSIMQISKWSVIIAVNFPI